MDVKFRKLFLRYYQQINIKNISKSFLNYLFSWNFLINTRIFKLCMYYTVQTMVCTRSRKGLAKELSFSHKFWFSNWYTFATWWCWPLIFQTIIIWTKMIQTLKYLSFSTFKCKDIRIRKIEFVTKTQFLYNIFVTGWCKPLIFKIVILILRKVRVWNIEGLQRHVVLIRIKYLVAWLNSNCIILISLQ